VKVCHPTLVFPWMGRALNGRAAEGRLQSVCHDVAGLRPHGRAFSGLFFVSSPDGAGEGIVGRPSGEPIYCQ